jgi:hypothetical protein
LWLAKSQKLPESLEFLDRPPLNGAAYLSSSDPSSRVYILLTGLTGITCRNRKDQRTSVEPAQEAFAFLSAQRFFIASDSLFLPAGVSRPRLFGAAVLGDNLFDRRFAQRRFIASDKRRRPSGVMPLRLLRATFRVGPLAFKPVLSSRAVIARCIFSLSRFNSAMILSRSNMVLLD